MEVYNKVQSGEVSGSATAKQLPDVPGRQIQLQAALDNTGNVYYGGPGVTKPDGTTDATSGIGLDAGWFSPLMPLNNLNLIYIICDNATDDVLYNVYG